MHSHSWNDSYSHDYSGNAGEAPVTHVTTMDVIVKVLVSPTGPVWAFWPIPPTYLCFRVSYRTTLYVAQILMINFIRLTRPPVSL